MVMRNTRQLNAISEGTKIKFTFDQGEHQILKGDIAIVKRSGKSASAKLVDSDTIVTPPSTTPVLIIEESPSDAARRKKLYGDVRSGVSRFSRIAKKTGEETFRLGKETVAIGKDFGSLIGTSTGPPKRGARRPTTRKVAGPKPFNVDFKRDRETALDAWYDKNPAQYTRFHNDVEGDGVSMLQNLEQDAPGAYRTLLRRAGFA